MAFLEFTEVRRDLDGTIVPGKKVLINSDQVVEVYEETYNGTWVKIILTDQKFRSVIEPYTQVRTLLRGN